MARYVDLDTAIENIRNGDGTPTQKLFAECCLLGIPTADVEPKSEVDHVRQCGYESGIRTGARKVFDAVDELIKDYAHNHLDPAELVVRLYLLKKKYTEENT